MLLQYHIDIYDENVTIAYDKLCPQRSVRSARKLIHGRKIETIMPFMLPPFQAATDDILYVSLVPGKGIRTVCVVPVMDKVRANMKSILKDAE
jgi:hypothetical protein